MTSLVFLCITEQRLFFARSGVLVLGLSKAGANEDSVTYTDGAYRNDVALGARIQDLANSTAIRAVFPSTCRIATFEEQAGYLNRDGGWANAGFGLSQLLKEVSSMGGKLLPGKGVTKLVRDAGRTTGVQCTDGTLFDADLVVLATGSWTPSTFPDLNLGPICLATG